MAVINHAKREINVKVVYFGTHGTGKGDLFRFIHQRVKPDLCGPLKSMSAGQDKLLFFDYIPFETSSLNGYRIRFHLYTLTGQVVNPGTWKMTLKGVDGLAFVTAGSLAELENSAGSLIVLRTMLAGYGRDLRALPRLWLHCANEEKDEIPVEKLSAGFFESAQLVSCSLDNGKGILESLARLSQDILLQLRNDFEPLDEIPEMFSEQSEEKIEGMPSVATVCIEPDQLNLSDVKISIGGDTVLRIPVLIESGESRKRYTLSVTLCLQEDSFPES